MYFCFPKEWVKFGSYSQAIAVLRGLARASNSFCRFSASTVSSSATSSATMSTVVALSTGQRFSNLQTYEQHAHVVYFLYSNLRHLLLVQLSAIVRAVYIGEWWRISLHISCWVDVTLLYEKWKACSEIEIDWCFSSIDETKIIYSKISY